MTLHRATRCLLILGLVALIVGVPAGRPALAQGSSASLTLLAQTPWNSLEDPVLSVTVLATNSGGGPLGELEVELGIGPNYASRLQYEASLIDGPSYTVHTEDFRFRGKMESGESRTFTIELDLSETPGISQTESLVYPARVSLLSGGEPVGAISTPLLFFFQDPEAPILFSTWVELDAPVAFAPDGKLADTGFEASLAAGGSLAAPVAAVRSLQAQAGSPSPVDVAVEPSLVEQAQRMAAGYARSDGTSVAAEEGGAATAELFLSQLADVATSAGVQTVSTPFSGPSLPAMLAGGLDSELTRQVQIGDAIMRDSFDVTPTPSISRPPDGLLSLETISWLAGRGTDIVLADADAVVRPAQEGGYAPPASATVSTPAGTSTLILPDPGVQSLLSRPELLADPVRGAQAILGEIAVIWKERPVPTPPEVRGLALGLDSSLPPGIWEPLMTRIAGAPFLRMVHAQDLATGVEPPGAEAELTGTSQIVLPVEYASRLNSTQADLDAYASMLTEDKGVSERLQLDLLYAQAGEFVVNEPAGQAWLDPIAATVYAAFRGTTPQVEQIFTLTSQEGSIPLRMGDPGPIPLRVTVLLQSSQFEFPEGDRREVTLQRPDQILTIPVLAKAAGRGAIRIIVLSPSGRAISQQTLIVQTTTVNTIALVVTGAAAGVLLLLYSRRWLRRRTSS